MSFHETIRSVDRRRIRGVIEGCTRQQVERALAARVPGLDELPCLLSPAAEPFLEAMAQRAHITTLQRFGRVISLFAPLYLSNVCTNRCVYCGFNAGNEIPRLTLQPDEAAAEAEALRGMGFRSVLLLTGEAPEVVSGEYLRRVLERVRPLFSSIGVEMFPMSADGYRELIGQGVDNLTVFQETYDEETYRECHPAGRKSDYRWRLGTAERGGEAGFRRLGIGALLGLSDWRVEGYALALHADYLQRHHWRSEVAISFPRLRASAGLHAPRSPVSDRDLVQLICALRIVLPDAGFSLSTREEPALRDRLVPLGVTTMSAGSQTEPGGYARPEKGGAQFDVADRRSPEAVAEMLRRAGYEPVWKEWDRAAMVA